MGYKPVLCFQVGLVLGVNNNIMLVVFSYLVALALIIISVPWSFLQASASLMNIVDGHRPTHDDD